MAMEFARRGTPDGRPIEIISADSMGVYKEMDIGTAKPTPADRAEIPHWCLDLVDPSEEYTIKRYQKDARAALDDIASRGAQPLLVGGAGLYIRAVVDNIDIPGQFPQVREELDAGNSTDQLYSQLEQLDPTAASRMEPNNRRRILRALEVTLGSGRPFSSYGEGMTSYPPTAFRQVGLNCRRAWLVERIIGRIHQQIDDGLEQEARRLWQRAGGLSRTARQALAYKELFDHFEGELSLGEAVDLVISRTRRFSRRQVRWFRRDPRIVWVDVLDGDTAAAAGAAVWAAMFSPD